MPSPSPSTTSPQSPRLGLPRRAKRGVIAAYIHEISPRHRRASDTPRVGAVVATPKA